MVPVSCASIRIHRRPISKPGLSEPVATANIIADGVPRRLCRADDNDRDPCDDDSPDGEELGDDEEAVEPRTSLRADRIRHADNHQNEDGEELMLDSAGLVGDAGGRVDALDEDDAESAQGSRHHGNDPGPGC